MKRFTLVSATCPLFILSACNGQHQKEKPPASAKEKNSATEGNWEKVFIETSGKKTEPKGFQQQFKMFHDGFFCLIMYDDLRNFALAGAGPYELTGVLYTETITYSSDNNYVNLKNS